MFWAKVKKKTKTTAFKNVNTDLILTFGFKINLEFSKVRKNKLLNFHSHLKFQFKTDVSRPWTQIRSRYMTSATIWIITKAICLDFYAKEGDLLQGI